MLSAAPKAPSADDRKDAIERSYDLAPEKLVMARKYIRPEDLGKFDAEWVRFKLAQKEI